MNDYGIKVSGENNNANEQEFEELILSSKYPTLKVAVDEERSKFGTGQAVIPNTGTYEVLRIPHGYDYTPASLTLVNKGGDAWYIAPTIWFFGEGAINAYCDEDDYVIDVRDIGSSVQGKTLKYRYYIFDRNGT